MSDQIDRGRSRMAERLISEQAVMESLTKEYNRRRTGDGLKLAWIEKAVHGTPSAQPERMHGKWEIYVVSPFDGEDCKCSVCGAVSCAPY